MHFFSKFRQNPEPIKDTVKKIKSGDSQLKNKLISDYTPFILKVVSKTTGKYVDTANSEEFSIGLMAFNEAIECFDENKNASFFNFAETVIKRRLIDYKRSIEKHKDVYPFTYFENDESEYSEPFAEKYLTEDKNHFENIETKEEIELFKKKLSEFGITLNDLVNNSPKHMDSKKLAISIARTLADNKELSQKMARTKKLPISDLVKIVDVSNKTLERNRRFIIAVYFILTSNLEVMMGYIDNIERGEKIHG